MVKTIKVALIAAALLALTACGITVLDNNRYGNFLQSYIVPGFKAQAQFDEECEFLAIDPNSNGIYVVCYDNTIIYYDENLKKVSTYEYSGFDADLEYCRFPASSRNIGNNTITMVPFNRLQWLVLFGDSMSFVEQITNSGVTDFKHSVQDNSEKPFVIGNHPLCITNGGQYNSNNPYSFPSGLAPQLAYTNGNRMYALKVDVIEPNSDNTATTYSMSLHKIFFMLNMNELSSFDGSPLYLSITVPADSVPLYLYVNDSYAAVIFGSQDQYSETATVCALFSKTTGELKQILKQNDSVGSGHYGFSATRIYYEYNKRLYAVEVTP